MTDKKRCEIDILLPHCLCGKELKIMRNGVHVVSSKKGGAQQTGDLWACKCGEYLVTVY